MTPPGCVQIQQWEQNLEKLNLDLFRLRCYQSSLQGGELPNPKSLLAIVGRPSKSMLGRLGVFSVSSFHALVRLAPPLSPSPHRVPGLTRHLSSGVQSDPVRRTSREEGPAVLSEDSGRTEQQGQQTLHVLGNTPHRPSSAERDTLFSVPSQETPTPQG